jgi:hypothetical protein
MTFEERFKDRCHWMGQGRHWASEEKEEGGIMTMKRITVAQHERALVWKNKTFAGVLEPRKHWLIAPMSDVQAQLYDLTVPEFEHPRVDFLVKEARETMEKYFDIVELTDSEAGLCLQERQAGRRARTRQAPALLEGADRCEGREDRFHGRSGSSSASRKVARASEAAARGAGSGCDQLNGSAGHLRRIAHR